MTNKDLLNKYFRYDKTTGKIYFKYKYSRKIIVGKEATSKKPDGYKIVCVNKKIIYQHRLAWLLHYGSWPSFHIDHIDGDTKNNSINNLRDVPNHENRRNMRVHRSGKPVGVSFNKKHKKWKASIQKDKKSTFLGYFEKIEDAVSAYNEAFKIIYKKDDK